MLILSKEENGREDKGIKKIRNIEKNTEIDLDLMKEEDPEKKMRKSMAENPDQNHLVEIVHKREEILLQSGIKTFINDLKVNTAY